MPAVEGSLRPIHYPLNRTVDMDSVTPDDAIANITLENWTTQDADEKINVVLSLSLNEYLAIANSVDVGRDIAYGDNSIFVWWIWVRSLQTMSICQAIIDCIEDESSGVADSIVNLIASNNVSNSVEVGQSQSGLLLGDGNNTACDEDTWWGGVNNLVDQMDTHNSDALQILEVITNINEWIAQVATGVAGVEIPFVQSMLDWGLFIQQSILENYEAQVTTAYLDEIKCDLFCIASQNCALTPEDIVDYFFERLGSQLTFESLLDESLEFIFFGIWTGTEIADAMMLSQLVFRAQLGRWFEFVAFNSVDLDLRLGFNDPSDDWILLCDTCEEWEEVFDFTTTEYASLIEQQNETYPSVWTDGVGYVNGKDGSGPRDGIKIIIPAAVELTFAEIRATITVTASNTRTTGVYVYDSFDALIASDYVIPQSGGAKTVNVSGAFDDSKEVHLWCGSRSVTASAIIKGCTLRGTGVNPFL